jgi:hypothetical protein
VDVFDNGLLAVHAFEKNPSKFDAILMVRSFTNFLIQIKLKNLNSKMHPTIKEPY